MKDISKSYIGQKSKNQMRKVHDRSTASRGSKKGSVTRSPNVMHKKK
jgi:hypothetical protein